MASDEDEKAVALVAEDEAAEIRGELYEVSPGAGMPVGMPSRFKVEYIEQARKLIGKGWTDAEVAEFFEIHVATYYRWRGLNPAFDEAVRSAKEVADGRVEDSLYRVACGYDKRIEKVFHSDGVITRAETVEHYPPNVRAAQIWLTNRDAKNWKNRQELTGKDGAPLNGSPQPVRSTVEIARRTMFLLNRAEDEVRGAPRTLLVEETIKETIEQ